MMVIPCSVYSRVVGYMRPVSAQNKGKAQEFKERNTYDKSFKEIYSKFGGHVGGDTTEGI